MAKLTTTLDALTAAINAVPTTGNEATALDAIATAKVGVCRQVHSEWIGSAKHMGAEQVRAGLAMFVAELYNEWQDSHPDLVAVDELLAGIAEAEAEGACVRDPLDVTPELPLPLPAPKVEIVSASPEDVNAALAACHRGLMKRAAIALGLDDASAIRRMKRPALETALRAHADRDATVAALRAALA